MMATLEGTPSDWGLADGLRHALSGAIAASEGIPVDDQRFESSIRETLVMGGNPLTPDEAAELLSAVPRLAHDSSVKQRDLLLCFYGSFEWYNRREKDSASRMSAWELLFRAVEGHLDGTSVYHYARSRFLHERGAEERCIEQARIASEIASEHIGFMNNFAELLLDSAESKLLSGDYRSIAEDGPMHDDLSFAETRLRELEGEATRVYPAFSVTRGRLLTCLGKSDEADACFKAARELLSRMHQEGDPRFADEDDYLSEIGSVITAQTTSSVITSSLVSWESMQRERERQEHEAAMLEQRMEELDGKLDDERVNMLEFLGFFSGIISFIIASVQVGSELEFSGRAALILVMLGALLIAFGALGGVLEGLRSRKRFDESGQGVRASGNYASWRNALMVVVGIAVVLLGIGVHLLVP